VQTLVTRALNCSQEFLEKIFFSRNFWRKILSRNGRSLLCSLRNYRAWCSLSSVALDQPGEATKRSFGGLGFKPVTAQIRLISVKKCILGGQNSKHYRKSENHNYNTIFALSNKIVGVQIRNKCSLCSNIAIYKRGEKFVSP
jgi:hypothetical protein